MPERVVIAGGGVAAQRCAFELRRRGFEGPVTIVSAEPVPPYDRTHLSKAFLLADEPALVTLGGGEAAYAERNIELLLGEEAVRLDAGAGRMELASGSSVAFDRLVICTGGRPRLPGALACPGVHVVREHADSVPLRETLERGGRLVVVGAGFIGGEVAAAAAQRGLEVTMVEAMAAPLAHITGTEVGLRVAAVHRGHGVDVRVDTPVARITRDRVFAVELGAGEVLEAEAVVVGVGMAPAVEWLAGSGLELSDGIVTNSICETALPGVLAAGDCARWWNPRYESLMRVEHWDTAGRHGAAAAASVLGADEPFAPIPFFWSDQYDVKFQWIGYAPVWDRVEVEEHDPPGTFVARYFADGALVAAFAANQPRELAAVRRELD